MHDTEILLNLSILNNSQERSYSKKKVPSAKLTMAGTGGPVATFSVWDYVVFAGTILGAAGIGLFQAIRGRKETSSAEFLLGGRQMTAVPVAMSLTASFMSGITVIGTPTEAYRFGAAFWLFGFSYAIMSVITAEIFVPLFYRLGITSAYEVRKCHC